jgi:hypothetical protein
VVERRRVRSQVREEVRRVVGALLPWCWCGGGGGEREDGDEEGCGGGGDIGGRLAAAAAAASCSWRARA